MINAEHKLLIIVKMLNKCSKMEYRNSFYVCAIRKAIYIKYERKLANAFKIGIRKLLGCQKKREKL